MGQNDPLAEQSAARVAFGLAVAGGNEEAMKDALLRGRAAGVPEEELERARMTAGRVQRRRYNEPPRQQADHPQSGRSVDLPESAPVRCYGVASRDFGDSEDQASQGHVSEDLQRGETAPQDLQDYPFVVDCGQGAADDVHDVSGDVEGRVGGVIVNASEDNLRGDRESALERLEWATKGWDLAELQDAIADAEAVGLQWAGLRERAAMAEAGFALRSLQARRHVSRKRPAFRVHTERTRA